MAVMDSRPLTADDGDVAAMRILASRAAAELERRHQAAALKRSRARVIETADSERRRVGRDLHDPPITSDVNAGDLPDDVGLAAYFIVSESLTNARRYAGAGAVRVRVGPVADALLVEIADDGCVGADPTAGTGLRGLQDRIDALDGRLEIGSPPGAGTRVSARLPLYAPG